MNKKKFHSVFMCMICKFRKVVTWQLDKVKQMFALLFEEVAGRSNVVYYHNMTKKIIQNKKWYSEKDDDIDDEAD